MQYKLVVGLLALSFLTSKAGVLHSTVHVQLHYHIHVVAMTIAALTYTSHVPCTMSAHTIIDGTNRLKHSL